MVTIAWFIVDSPIKDTQWDVTNLQIVAQSYNENIKMDGVGDSGQGRGVGMEKDN